MSAKKAIRSLLVLAPELQEARFAAQRSFLRMTGISFRPDVDAMRHLSIANPVVVDIGANRGFSIDSILALKPKAKIIAFEPYSRFADDLAHRYQSNRNVTVMSYALGREASELSLYVPIYRRYTFDALASLSYAEAAGWPNEERFYWFDKSKIRVETETVQVRPLDEFDLAPDVLKIYAQGHEVEIVTGGERTIAEFEPAIMVPARIPKIDACLKALGYGRFAFRKGRLLPEGEGHTSSWYFRPRHHELFSCPMVAG